MFRTKANVGANVPLSELRDGFEAIVLAGGSTMPARPEGARPRAQGHLFRDGVPDAAEQALRRRQGSGRFISAEGKHVIIIGGGDTGADCLGTAHRQGARSVRQLELLHVRRMRARPSNPWPLWPNIFRVSSAHEEGGERLYSISTDRFSGDANGERQEPSRRAGRDGRWQRTDDVQARAGQRVQLDADLVLLAMGFVGPEKNGLLTSLA